jgi:hypothetical protein
MIPQRLLWFAVYRFLTSNFLILQYKTFVVYRGGSPASGTI